MLTKEQIKNLKPGDTILIQGTFDSRTEFGNICYISKFASENGVFFTSSRTAHPSLIYLPKNSIKNTEEAPKYDPCRIFKEGDIVSPKSWYDRKPWSYSNSSIVRLNTCWKCTVIADEHRGIVKCKTNSGYLFETAPCFLELVTPVDELEPYIVGESTDYFSVDDREGEELSIYWKNKHPHAKEAAEAECNRLNDEHRKEQ